MRISIFLAATLMLASCGTIEGAGEDISSASRTVQGWF
ncbi:MAG: entericidin EcnA/B family protein [Pseudomonadota bacterium]|jgi:predicted small secreted protein|uniref:Predicted small secreted protein n=1 Tax=Thalassococcus halodurans TaxID=373675 RepID=A0A1H5W2T4_9RHOB|nr:MULTISPECIES: entericidin EcnA/B family protein [Thalassococcus]MEC7670477.1 entericidin EcnA/B family protein [Pseudomonadota bacterium]MBO6867743.1 entericidin EcnA/B family protein [Thalassococcus sp.]MEC8580512.1 entericidin EcnA/B family protein [Pseudomonadota bacterium]MEE3359572.1 entericidin EcnA/B family protein [Pseudomonadota bacterium]SEF93760.1 Predicted small secreted protein [Thalassococcus halodurans]